MDIIKQVKEAVSIPVYVQVSDSINMGVASALAAISKGVDGIKSAMVGKDILLTGEFSDAMRACGSGIDAEIKLDTTKIHTSTSVNMMCCRRISYT